MLIITGPNMAGKSTFLRTLGVNGVLALSGAPVCASRFEISPLKLITSMQSADSLDKHLSLFYAELQRLKLILDNIAGSGNEKGKGKTPVFFLIDEMLKGTNAVDRQKGSIALLEQLIAENANGTVATHDLKLTHLEKAGKGVRNYHFDGEIKEDKLIFDYKLRTGICKSANALILMKKVGINLSAQIGKSDQTA
jgi:DNA mismatch repair ATPase MutS